MKVLPALRRNWRHSLSALLLFLCFWHSWTVASLVSRAKHEVSAVAAKSVIDIDAALRSGDLIALRNAVGKLQVDGVHRLEFHGPRTGALDRFSRFTVGSPGAGGFGSLRGGIDLSSNGASLGHVDYELDLLALNRRAIGGNWVLYAAAALFMALVTVLANMGTLKVLSQVESVLGGISGGSHPTQADALSAILENEARASSSDPAIQSLFGLLAQYSLHLENARKAEADIALARKMETLAAMVAHDIRAPLSVLESALGGDEAVDASRQSLARSAMKRIAEIADDVLVHARGESSRTEAAQGSEPSVEPLEPLILSVMREVADRPAAGERAQAVLDASHDVSARVEAKAFSRVLSNLCSNALEAAGRSGTILVSARAQGRDVVVTVTDTGPGIPPDILPKLGQRGATFGKEGGTGLGLWHARTTVESWGGRLEIESEVGKGTTVRLILPRAQAPASPETAVLVDDDPLVRMNWTLAAKKAGKSLKAYADPRTFIKEASDLPKETPIFIDSDLGEGLKGEEAAKELSALGFTELHLSTGHDPASFPPLPCIKSIRGKEPPWDVA